MECTWMLVKLAGLALLLASATQSTSVRAFGLFGDNKGDNGFMKNYTVYQPRIIGGTNAPNIPFVAQVIDNESRSFCGGSIIDKSYVLTAAHCCHTANVGSYDVRYDTNELNQGKKVEVSSMMVYPSFIDDGSGQPNDVCLLRLKKPVNLRSYPILDDGSFSDPGLNVLLVGYGSMQPTRPGQAGGGGLSTRMLQARSPIVSQVNCRRAYGSLIDNSMLCTGYADGRNEDGVITDTCSGDSGSPVLVMNGGQYVEVGIVSFGQGCGITYSVNARVSTFRSWITDMMKACDAYIDSNGGTACAISGAASSAFAHLTAIQLAILPFLAVCHFASS